MGDPAVRNEIMRRLDDLSGDQQNRVLDFVARVGASPSEGSSLEEIEPLSGIIDDRSAQEMQASIEEACERVDADEW